MRDLFRGIGDVLYSSWRAGPGRLAVSVLLLLLGSVSGPLIALFLARVTDSVIEGDMSAAVTAASAMAVMALLSLTMEHFAHIFFFELADLHHIRVEQEIGELVQGSASLEQHERSDHADRLALLRKESGSIDEGVQTVLSSITLLVQILLTGFLLARLEPLLLFLPVFAFPPLLAGRLAERYRNRAELRTAEDTRRAWHLLELSVHPASAKELRLFGLGGVLRQRQATLLARIDARQHRAELMGLGLRSLGQLFFVLGYVGALILVIRMALAGQGTAGDVVLVLTLAVQTNAQAAAVVSLAQSLQRNARAMSLVRWLRAAAPAAAAGDAPCPDTLHVGIELSGVAFRYPGADRDVLSEVTVRIPRNTTVAIVGDNGAGKSTLVKLLCGFYRPTRGSIRVDGVDLARISPARWRERLSAGFQDFVRLETPARESVGAGDLEHLDTPGAVESAVRRADAEAVVARLPDGLASQLGTTYEDGEELSGGQWQRIALSRAMMPQSPLLLLLDEPTAALDPLTEHELFQRYAASAREVGERSGGITVLVSHRFSTVRMADLILVVSGGRLTEAGSHADLMAADGVYAELFSLQAAAYDQA
jgi:ATP-binding cassette, subfamily B, bacterial